MASKPSGLRRFERELVVTVIVITVAVGAFWWWRRCTEVRCGLPNTVTTHNDLMALRTTLIAYRAMAGTYPSTTQGLKALVERPQGEPVPVMWHPVIPEGLKKDAWGRDYIYQCPGTKHPKEYDLYSLGEDGVAGTADDIWPD